MRPRVRSSLLWGVVGGLVLLVLVQGMRLLGGPDVSTTVVAGAALVAGVGAAVATYLVEGRLLNGQA